MGCEINIESATQFVQAITQVFAAIDSMIKASRRAETRFAVRLWSVIRAHGIQPAVQPPHSRHAMRARKMRRYLSAR